MQRVLFVPNPCTFIIQELAFGCVSEDVVSDMIKMGIGRPRPDITLAVNHLIDQRRCVGGAGSAVVQS